MSYLQLGNTGSGSGTVGPGTTNKVAKFTSTTTIGDSNITDNGTQVIVGVTLSDPGAGSASERFGSNTAAAGTNSVAIGNSASSASNDSIVIGSGSSSNATGSIGAIIIGKGITGASGAGSSVIIGAGATIAASSAGSIVIGPAASSTGVGATVVGPGATGADFSFAMGYGATATSQNTAIGFSSQASSGTAGTALCIGNFASCIADYGIAIGPNSQVNNNGCIVIGDAQTSARTNEGMFGFTSSTNIWSFSPYSENPFADIYIRGWQTGTDDVFVGTENFWYMPSGSPGTSQASTTSRLILGNWSPAGAGVDPTASGRLMVATSGRIVVGDITDSSSFFINDQQKLSVNQTNTHVSSSAADFIQITSVATTKLSPTAATNSGVGVAVYATQGFNLDITSSFAVNGGIAVGGSNVSGEVISAIGAFGQVNINSTGNSVDGVVGALCTANHNGLTGGAGCAVTTMIGGDFAVLCDGANGATVSGSLSLAIGGRFTMTTSGITPTTAIGGRFDEPDVFDAGTGVGTPALPTNKTAIDCRGTISFKQLDTSSTGNIDAFASTRTYNYMTGAAPVLRGINNDTFNKMLIFDFANTATISNENATPTAAKRITTGTGADLLLVKSACLVYNTTTSRWRVQWWRI